MALTLCGVRSHMENSSSFSEYFYELRCSAEDALSLSVPIAFLNDLTQATSRTAVLDIYSVWAHQILEAARCSIALDDGTDTLLIMAANGRDGVKLGTRHSINDSIIGSVFKHRKTIFAPDTSQVASSGTQRLAAMGFRSLISAPLVSGKGCAGVINASFLKPPDNTDHTVAMLEAIGRCLATQLLVVDQVEELARQARTDALTGAANRYVLYESAADTWAAWHDGGIPFSFAATDVDHFKQINDTYGHNIGDAVLSAFARRMRARTRAGDIFIRMGGEEFGLLMPETTLSNAARLTGRLCGDIGASPFVVEKTQLSVTASFGVTQVFPSDKDFNDVLKRADRALYLAKASGRDQVVTIAQEELIT